MKFPAFVITSGCLFFDIVKHGFCVTYCMLQRKRPKWVKQSSDVQFKKSQISLHAYIQCYITSPGAVMCYHLIYSNYICLKTDACVAHKSSTTSITLWQIEVKMCVSVRRNLLGSVETFIILFKFKSHNCKLQ